MYTHSEILHQYVERCFDRMADRLFKMVADEEDMALRRGMDSTLDYTINWHRMRMMRHVGAEIGEVGVEFIPDFDREEWITKAGLRDE
jgi:hypothetical protein